MTLTSRLLLFFLATLALVLGGFSVALYGTAAVYLDRQATERLQAGLHGLAAAAEIENGRVEWEPHNRSIQVDADGDASRLSWRVTDAFGRALDGSSDTRNVAGEWAELPALSAVGDEPVIADSRDGQWRVARATVAVPDSAANADAASEARQALVIDVAVPLAPMHALLTRLGWLAGILSLSLWFLAAAAGRAICRRALRPLAAMASAARSMRGDALSQRLPEPGTGDECQDLARAFNELLSRVEEAFERQRQFTGSASHQLRTPLAAILGQVEVALRRDRSSDEYRSVLLALEQRAAELRQLVETLLFLARADGEALIPDMEAVELGPWLRECLDDWSTHPRSGDLRLELDGHVCCARLHRSLAGQLIGNLLDNACKHTSPGTPITVRLVEEADTVRLEVEDRGEGISESELPLIFEPFYRSPDARRRGLPGAGLGLAVAKRIAQALRGQLSVQSQLGRGSRFEVLLPRCDLPRPGLTTFLRSVSDGADARHQRA